MKTINKPGRLSEIKYPKNSPRVSRKRVWMDRSEWRKSPEMIAEASGGLIDNQLENARNVGTLEQQNYLDLADLTDRAGRIGINKT